MKHFVFVNSSSNAMFICFSEIGSFEKIKNRVAKTALIIVFDIYYCFYLLKTQAVAATLVPREACTSSFSR